jgi:hypothetical protein
MTTNDALENEQISASKKDLKLWLRARDECEKRLGHLPSNEEMVDFAQSKAGAYVHHLFPFGDLRGSARKHWIFLAGCYTRRATIIFASDPTALPERVRALHVVRDTDGHRGVATIAQVADSKSYVGQVLADARSAMLSFQSKYEQLARVLKSAKLMKAVQLAIKAAKELDDE